MDFIDHRSTAKFIFKTSATDEKARIDDSGNILTGKTSSNFSTAGAEVRNVGQVWATRDGGTPLALNRLSSDGTIAQFYKDGATVGRLGSFSGACFIAGTSYGVRFGSAGLIPSGATGANSHNTFDLGDNAVRWKDLYLSGNANIGGNAVITGNLTVNGTTTTINTATLDVEDKNITLNYGTGDTSSTADGAGITIQDAVDASNNATILWDATNDEFDFSHPINVTGNVTSSSTVIAGTVPRMYTSSDRGYFVAGTNDASNQHLYLGSYHGSTLKELTFSGSNNAFYPQTSGAIDLGLSSKKFKNLQLSGTITFAGGTTSANLNFGDNDKAIFGTGSDLQIYHDGSNSYITDAGTGDLKIRSNKIRMEAPDSQNMLIVTEDAGVQAFYNGTQRLEVTNTGIDVTGTVTADGLTVDSTLATIGSGGTTNQATELRLEGTSNAGNGAYLRGRRGGSSSFLIGDTAGALGSGTGVINYVYGSNPWTVYTNGDERLTVNGNGDISFYEDTGTIAKLTWDASAETLNFADNGKAVFGAGSDLQIYHDGSNSYIDDAGSGRLNIRASDLRIEKYTGETIAKFLADGAVELNYNDVKKLATTATGINVTGTVTADGLTVDGATVVEKTAINYSTGVFSAPHISLKASVQPDDNDGFVGVTFATSDSDNYGWSAGSERTSGGAGDFVLTNHFNSATGTQAMRLHAGGDISFYEDTGTTAKLFWDASTEFLGLGSTAPQAKLDIVDTASDVQMRVYKNDGVKNTRLTLTADDSGAKIHYRDADNAGALRFNNNLGEVMRITANTTRVGIGTSAPLKALHVKSGSEVVRIEADASTAVYQTFFRAGTRVGYQGFGSTGDIYYLSNDTANGSNYYMVNGTGSHRFYNDTSELVRIDSSGNVGIGRASSSVVRLSVAGADASSTKYAFEATNNSNNTRFIVRNDGQSQFFKSDNAASMTVTSAGNVGIGTSIPEKLLHLKTSAINTAFARIESTATNSYPTLSLKNDAREYQLTAHGPLGDVFTIYDGTAGSHRLVIDSSGNLLVGKTSPSSASVGFQAGQDGFIAATRTSSEPLVLNRLTSDGDIASFRKNGTTVGSIGTLNRLTIGNASSGISFNSSTVAVQPHNMSTNLAADATVSLGVSGARFKDLYLSNNIVSSGASSPTLNLKDTTNNCNILVYAQNSDAHVGTYSNHPLIFDSNSSERMRLEPGGNILIGKTTINNTSQGIRFLGSSGFMSIVRSSGTAIIVNRLDSNGDLMQFRRNGTTVGSISATTSATSFNTTSDERAKDNIQDAPSASDDIDAIQVRSFDWKADGTHQKYGMIAQELSTVAPDAVTVPEDAEEMQSVDYSKLVPMLVREIQSLRARVAQLEGDN